MHHVGICQQPLLKSWLINQTGTKQRRPSRDYHNKIVYHTNTYYSNYVVRHVQAIPFQWAI
jgi:hypothetical protein